MATGDSGGPRHEHELGAAEWTLVGRLALFQGLEADALERLLATARVIRRPRGSQLFVQDEPATHFFVILDGWVKIYRVGVEGDETIVHVFTRGESFAEAAIFAGARYPVSAAVADPARLLSVPAGSFLRTLDTEPRIARNMLAAMSRHLRELVTALERIQSRSASERVAGFLLELAPEAEEGPLDLRLPIDKSLIAARLGMKPETLSRALARLRHEGIGVDQDRVRVPDRGVLRRLAGT